MPLPEPKPIAEGDFLRLFVKNEEALRAFARVLLPTWESVDEVMQEASVIMWKKLPQLDLAENFLPWAKVIVRFEALRLRREEARDRHVFSAEVLDLLANEALEVPEDTWVREREALGECLGQLADHHRELVLAPYAGESRVTRLAEETGRSINSLYKLLSRLREKLVLCVENKLANEAAS
jgi:RNA polymerase sigma-70 factor (ECF subfamily)